MNTKEVQEKIAGLAMADKAAYKAGTRTNLVIDYLRNELIKRAFEASEDFKEKISVQFSMTVASYVMPSLALLSKTGNYPKLFAKANIELDEGEITLTYTINAKGLSNEYRQYLSDKIGIKIPALA